MVKKTQHATVVATVRFTTITYSVVYIYICEDQNDYGIAKIAWHHFL